MIAFTSPPDTHGRSARSLLRRIGSIAMLAASAAVVASCSDDPAEPEEALGNLQISAPSSVDEGDPFTVTVTAVGDQGTSPFTDFSGNVTLAVTGGFGTGTIEPNTVDVVNGTGSVEVTLINTSGDVTLEGTSGSLIGTTTIAVVTDTRRRLPGDPSLPAADAIPARDYEPDEDDYGDDNPELGDVFVSFNTIIMSLETGTTIGEANDILVGLDAEIIGGIPGEAGEVEGILMIQVPTTSHGELDDVLADLRGNPAVLNVAPDALLTGHIIPGDNGGTPSTWTWGLTPGGGNWGMEIIRAPQMWNLNDGISNTTVTGILDVGFADSHPDLTWSDNQTPGDTHDHGTHVAGTVAADFDNGAGVDGVNPSADLVVRAMATPSNDGTTLGTRAAWGQGFMNGVEDLIESSPDMRVMNMSLGFNWGPAGVDQDVNAPAQELVMEMGGLFRTLLVNLAQDNDLPILVVTSGNDSNDGFGTQEARWGSPMTYAGLVLDPPVPGAPNPILVVESVALMTGATGGATRSGFSNLNGHISAPGSSIWSTVTGSAYASMSGTSMAAPHVTGLISFLYALEPDLTHEQVFDVLYSNAIAVDGDASPRIDAFASAMDLDRVTGGMTARLALLDVNGDGAFDEADLDAAVSAFDDFEDFDTSCSVPMSTTESCPIYSRFDLNGSGLGGDDATTRFDLDNSGSYDAIINDIAGTDVTFDQSAVTDLHVLCYNAYSSLYTGDTEQRSDLLDGRCREIRVVLDDMVMQDVTIDLPDPVEGEVGADVMFNVDLSGSFFDDLSTFQAQASAIVGALQVSLPDLRVGVSSFVDAPCNIFGSLESGDYGHNLDLALTNDFDAFQAILDGLSIYFGVDGPESQLESMYQTMTGAGIVVEDGTDCDGVADIPGSTPGWTNDRLRFVMHSTDASFHRPTDGGYPYPRGVDDVIATANETGTRIYVLDSGGGSDADKTTIADQTGGEVFELDAASSTIVEAVEEAAGAAITNATVRLVPLGDDAGLVESIEPMVIEDVDLTTTRTATFTVTFVNTVTPQPEDQTFRFEFVATVNGATVERRPVVVVVPGTG